MSISTQKETKIDLKYKSPLVNSVPQKENKQSPATLPQKTDMITKQNGKGREKNIFLLEDVFKKHAE